MKALRLVLVSFISILIASSYAFAAGPEVADWWYPGGVGSFWTYRLDNGREVTLTVDEQWKKIDGRTYKVIKESAPLWGHAIDRFLTSDPLPKYFGAERLNPFLVCEERGNHIAGYAKLANAFIEEEMDRIIRDMGAVFTLKPVSTQWVLLKELSTGNTWTVFNCDYRLAFLGDRVDVESSVQGRVIGTDGIISEAGEFDTFIVRYTYAIEDSIDEFCQIWIADIGPVWILIDGKLTAELVRYEIKPSGPPPEPRAISSRNRLITAWGQLRKNP